MISGINAVLSSYWVCFMPSDDVHVQVMSPWPGVRICCTCTSKGANWDAFRQKCTGLGICSVSTGHLCLARRQSEAGTLCVLCWAGGGCDCIRSCWRLGYAPICAVIYARQRSCTGTSLQLTRAACGCCMLQLSSCMYVSWLYVPACKCRIAGP